jgi:hypothetical protein
MLRLTWRELETGPKGTAPVLDPTDEGEGSASLLHCENRCWQLPLAAKRRLQVLHELHGEMLFVNYRQPL